MTNQRIGHRTPVLPPHSSDRRRSLRTSAHRIARESLHALLGLPLGVAAFSWEVSELSVAASLLATVVGLPLLVIGGRATRWLSSRLRSFSNAMTGDDVPAPPALRPRPGVLGWIGFELTDGATWRARLYLLLKLPLGLASSATAVTLYASGATALTYWMWRPLTSCDAGADGTCHRSGDYVARHHLDSAVNLSVLAFAGLVALILTPRVVRGLLALDRMLVRTLLGPGRDHHRSCLSRRATAAPGRRQPERQ
jgi:Putative sensor